MARCCVYGSGRQRGPFLFGFPLNQAAKSGLTKHGQVGILSYQLIHTCFGDASRGHFGSPAFCCYLTETKRNATVEETPSNWLLPCWARTTKEFSFCYDPPCGPPPKSQMDHRLLSILTQSSCHSKLTSFPLAFERPHHEEFACCHRRKRVPFGPWRSSCAHVPPGQPGAAGEDDGELAGGGGVDLPAPAAKDGGRGEKSDVDLPDPKSEPHLKLKGARHQKHPLLGRPLILRLWNDDRICRGVVPCFGLYHVLVRHLNIRGRCARFGLPRKWFSRL